MGFFSSKQTVNLQNFVREWYDKNLFFTTLDDSIDMDEIFIDEIKENITEVEPKFSKIPKDKLSYEIMLIRLELFGLAWEHRFKEELGIKMNIFTKKYLSDKKKRQIWKDLLIYNQAIADSSLLEMTPETGRGRQYLTFRNLSIMNRFDEYCKKGYDGECIARALNREFTDVAWKDNITRTYILRALCQRLKYLTDEVNEEFMFRFNSYFYGFYNGALNSMKEVKIIE